MKSLKNVLAALAFVFAFGAALATSANSSTLVTAWAKPFGTGPCTSGTLNESGCVTTDQTYGRCTVTINSRNEEAFQISGCSMALFKSTP